MTSTSRRDKSPKPRGDGGRSTSRASTTPTSTSAKARKKSAGRGTANSSSTPSTFASAAGAASPPDSAAAARENENAASPLHSFAAAASYVVVSMLMTLLNKQIISKLAQSLLFCECFIATALVYPTLKRTPQPLQPQNLKYLFLCTAAKAGNMYFSFLSMKYTSLPVYNVLKRMSPIAALLLDYFLRKKTYPLLAKLGMVCVFLGAIVTGSGDLEFEVFGYVCAVCAVMGQSSYLVLCARALDNLPGLSHVDVLFYTGFYNQFLFFPLAVMEGTEIQNFWTNTQIAPVYLLAVFALYVFQGTLLNYVTFWCTSVTSPVTTGVCGNIKALLTSLVGVVLFSARLSPLGWTGFALNSCGGFVYSLATAREKMKQK